MIKYIMGTTKNKQYKNKVRNNTCCSDISYVFYVLLLWPIELFRITYKKT